MKTLLLKYDITDFFSKESKKYDIDVESAYWPRNKILKLFRNIFLFQMRFGIVFWLGRWKKKIQDYDLIIIHSGLIAIPIVEYLSKIYPEKRIIVWFWNSINDEKEIRNYQALKCELWSFDKSDCQKYDIKYNHQFYFKTIIFPQNIIEWDIFFVGEDKGRLEKILMYEECFKNMGLTVNVNVVNSSNRLLIKKSYKERMSYSEVLINVSKSNAILDIVKEGQHGLTLRPLEALFFKKKLITDNRDILDYDFYHPQNIFVLGKDDLGQLKQFISSPYVKISNKIIDRYDFSNWIQSFYNRI